MKILTNERTANKAIPVKVILIVISLTLSAGIFVSGCEGPQGPSGLQGEQGDQGEQGPVGEEGDDGNANVIYSNWLDADWNDVDNPQYKQMRISMDGQIDYSDLRNNALVMVYVTNYGSSAIYPLPSSGRWSEDEVLYSFDFGSNASAGRGLQIMVESLDGTDLTEYEYTASRGTRFRYVLIPGSTSAKTSAGKEIPRETLKNMSYDEVASLFNIPQ